MILSNWKIQNIYAEFWSFQIAQHQRYPISMSHRKTIHSKEW